MIGRERGASGYTQASVVLYVPTPYVFMSHDSSNGFRAPEIGPPLGPPLVDGAVGVAAMRRACAELASTSAPRRARWALDAARAMVEGMMRARGVHGGAREVAIERWSSDLMEVRRRASCECACVVARAWSRVRVCVMCFRRRRGTRAWGVRGRRAVGGNARARGCIFWNAECGMRTRFSDFYRGD